ncbi:MULTISPECIES: TadE/TadG family type IV pilus assembly protein [unclassified Pseudomonas]|uniref:TadE/TadG family type IV pilus assembly protein n=1 Tax=unclassified Pseudomonas TaxID=196821 RepID=UPI002AC9741A|nr:MULTISPECIES: TadE/TadG family type IV pilus assembly protein [unclassified Pseudomonas]MEB0041626.1 pilus assembly protein [Pseudomonas sp. MH10]MEB0121998.1 pilus assembly protein [Pseudomonas sp. CCI1.2]WPX61939.1 pilus assembly protein [Pseudomonas sp. MH10]
MQNTSFKSRTYLTFNRKQKGAAAIEFAAVFITFFAVFYGLVSYSLPLLMMQSFNAATTEAVRRAVAVSPTVSGYQGVIQTQASATVLSQLAWMPAALGFDQTSVTAVYNTASKLLTVSINYPVSKLANVVPPLVLPVIGQVPSLPTFLTAQASLQLGP